MTDLTSTIAASRTLQSVLHTPPQPILVPEDGFPTPRIRRARPFTSQHGFYNDADPFTSPTPIGPKIPASPFSSPSVPIQLIEHHPLTLLTKSINDLVALTQSVIAPPPDPPPEILAANMVLRQKLLFEFTADVVTKLVKLISAIQDTEDKAWTRGVGSGWTDDDGTLTVRAHKKNINDDGIAVDGDQTIKPVRKAKRGVDGDHIMEVDGGAQTKELRSPAQFTNGTGGQADTAGPEPTEWIDSPRDGWDSTPERDSPETDGAPGGTRATVTDDLDESW